MVVSGWLQDRSCHFEFQSRRRIWFMRCPSSLLSDNIWSVEALEAVFFAALWKRLQIFCDDSERVNTGSSYPAHSSQAVTRFVHCHLFKEEKYKQTSCCKRTVTYHLFSWTLRPAFSSESRSSFQQTFHSWIVPSGPRNHLRLFSQRRSHRSTYQSWEHKWLTANYK